jgi:hypothetical protein
MLTWHIAQVSTVAERRAVRALRDNGFTVVQPCFTEWKAVPKAPREKVKTPLFPGYLFVGQGPDTPFDRIHDKRSPIWIIPHGWPADALSDLICDFAFRELAGEFDKTGEDRYQPPKPVTGPLTRTLGTGLTCLKSLLTMDDRGRLQLLTSGNLIEGAGPLDTSMEQAA